MNAFARILVGLAVLAHAVLSVADANASVAALAGDPLAAARSPAVSPPLDSGWLQIARGNGNGGATGGSTGGSTGGATGSAAGAGSSGGTRGHGGFGLQRSYGGGPAPAVSGECAAGLELPDPDAYSNPLEGLQAISDKTQSYIERCGCQTQNCIADALDKYADALDEVTSAPAPTTRRRASAPHGFSPAIRALPRIVRAAAARVRAAPTPKAAVRILRVAAVVIQKTVRKEIALMRASDPDAEAVATRGGDLVADTLKTAATQLARADTL